jgi:hypothetical protein
MAQRFRLNRANGRWPIDRLIPYAKNSRTHSEAQIAFEDCGTLAA